jgi:transcriptional regulator of aromatic amino acid metabolism
MATGAFPISSSERNESYVQRQWNGQDGVKTGSIHEVARSRSDEHTRDENEFHGIIGSSPALKFVLTEVELVAPTNSTVLIWGNRNRQGTDSSCHSQSECSREFPFVKLNCAAIPFDLLESELFGHEKVLSPEPSLKKLAALKWRTMEHSFLMRSGTSRSHCNLNFCAFCRNRSSNA